MGRFYPLLIAILAIVFIYPLILMLSLSFKSAEDILLHPFSIPFPPHLDNYRAAWEKASFFKAFLNSSIITLGALLVIITIGALASYPLARRSGKLSKLLYIGFVAGLAVPFQLNIIPLYILMKSIHLTNTYTGIILIYATLGIPFTVFLFTGFFNTIPRNLDEAATIDGCSPIRIFFLILFPLLKPVTATIAILQGLNYWNQFFIPSIFMPSTGSQLVPNAIYTFMGMYTAEWDKIFPIMVSGVVPLLLVYLFLQRYVIAGMTAGAIKG